MFCIALSLLCIFCLFKTGISHEGFAIKAVLVTQVTDIIEIYRPCFVLFFCDSCLISFFCMLMFIVFFIPVGLPVMSGGGGGGKREPAD